MTRDSGPRTTPLAVALREFADAEADARTFAELADAVTHLCRRAGYKAHVQTNVRRITVVRDESRRVDESP